MRRPTTAHAALLLSLSPVLVLTSLASGCATLQQMAAKAFRKPTLTFKNASLTDVSLGSTTVNLSYQLQNPNPFGLSLASVDYAFFVEGKQVVAGSPPGGLSIPASGSTVLVLPASVKFAELAPVLETFLTKDVAAYRAQGSVGVQTPLGIIKIPLSKEGTFPVPKLPQVALQSPRITRITVSSATLEMPLLVTNQNDFPLPIAGLSAAVAISGSRVGTISSPDLGTIGPRAQLPVNLPLTVDFLQAMNAAAALQAGSAVVSLDAEIRSGPAVIPIRLRQNVSFRR